MEITTTTKRRTDAWESDLSEAQRWTVYHHMQKWNWEQAAEWAAKEYNLSDVPSRSAMYRFHAALRPLASEQRLLDSIKSGEEAEGLAANTTADAVTVSAYKSMAQGLSLAGDPKTAMQYTQMALAITDRILKQRDQDIKERAQATKDEALKLAREKFEAAEIRATAAEKRADAAEAKAEELQTRINELETALQDAGKTTVADPHKVVDELDKLLGRKPK